MDRENLILKLLGMLLGESETGAVASIEHPRVGEACIVRASGAGVWFGRVTAVRPEFAEVDLGNARRMWSWFGQFSLSELALQGPKTSAKNKYAAPVAAVTIAGYCELIPVCPEAATKIMGVPNANEG